MTDRQVELLTKLVVAIIQGGVWAGLALWSGWMEWHSQHEHAVWLLLLLMANSLCWLKSIEHNTDRIPRQ